jgi:alkanesulfonate monooxygenase SsuD/methylene tetrahydromethanopterin reductase-like flavin-dependent oxidoreductase (luciferase family)
MTNVGISIIPYLDSLDRNRELVRVADEVGLALLGVQDHAYQRHFFDSWSLSATLLAETKGISFSIRLVGRKADGWLPSFGVLSREEPRAGNGLIDQASAAAGRDPRAIRRILNLQGVIGDEPPPRRSELRVGRRGPAAAQMTSPIVEDCRND